MKSAGAVELPDRDQVEEVDEPRELGDRSPERDAGDPIHRIRGNAGAEPPHWAGESDASVGRRIVDVLLEEDERTNARDEQGRAGRDAQPPELGDVSHLVDVDRYDEPRGQRPPKGRPVQTEKGEHREEGARLRQTQYQELELTKREDADDDERRRGTLPPGTVPGRAALRAGRRRRSLRQLGDPLLNESVRSRGGREELERTLPAVPRRLDLSLAHLRLGEGCEVLQRVGVNEGMA